MRWGRASLMAIVMALILVAPTLACTGITLHAADGSMVRGRTMEFGNPLDSDVIFIPQGIKMAGTTPSGDDNGLQWSAKYAAAGANGMGLPVLLDGLNEKGLSGGIFYFPTFADYQDVTDAEISRTIAPWQVLTSALTSFATVDEVQAAIPDIRVANVTFGVWNIVPPAHYVLTDATGKKHHD